MSTFYGVFQRTGLPVKRADLDAVTVAMARWQPDRQDVWCEGQVALGHFMLWNSPESRLERLPSQADSLVITCDARLDNRDELQAQLEVKGNPPADSDLLLAAYGKWGEDCPRYLLGDFAFIIWDGDKQQLFCVRDHLGIKPFYFHLTDDLFFGGNDLRGMSSHNALSAELNPEAVANYIAHSLLLDPEHTLLQGVQKLPAGHTLVVTASTWRKHCYWRPQDAPRVKLPDAEAYADRLRQLLKLAVYDRMRSDYPITSHLSGGIDSSTIAVLAARKLKEKGETLLAFNWLHEPGVDDDSTHYEFAHSKDVAEAEGIDHSYVYINAEDIYEQMSNHNVAHGDSAGFWYEYVVRAASQEKGSRTILSGWGGDELATYHGNSYLSDLFLSGHWGLLFRELLQGSRRRKRIFRSMLSVVYQNVFLPLVPRRLYRFMPRNRNNHEYLPHFVKQGFAAVLQNQLDKESVLGMQPQPRIRSHMEAYLLHGHIQARVESWAASAVDSRLEYCYPLLDKRIVEFILGVPAKYFMHEGIGRYLFRKATKGLLSEDILWANAKVEKQRVDRLLEMNHVVCHKMSCRLLAEGKDSQFVDIAVLKKSLDEHLKYDDFATVCILVEASVVLSVVLSELNVSSLKQS